MARVRRINVSQIEGNTSSSSDKRPNGEMALYENNNNNFDFVIHNGTTGTNSNKVFSKGIFYGYGSDSADGAGLNTIKLIPDSVVFGNGSQQYLIVDPTFPNHIHLRAGGTIDNSSASLYIGGENSYLNIPNGSNPAVNISANNNVWQFGTNGGLTFPDSSVQTTAYTGGADTLDTVTDRGATTTNNITIGTVTTVSVIGASSPVVGFNITGVPFPEGQGAGFTWTWVSSGPEVTQLIAQGNALIGAQVTQSEFPGTLTVLSLPNLGGTLGIELDGAITYSPTNTLTFVSTNYTPSSPLPLDINAGSNTWTFGTTGTLTFPDATVQTTAYVPGENVTKTSGTWTVTPGTANYEFTVPINGVYQLWVRGNIPNGIISYTATVAVTNNNVPVLGVQYAWNYTGAGNPILFTSIPDQIIGTAGAISTASPSVGTTTNTFVFGISNSTAENVTIDWGYIKIS